MKKFLCAMALGAAAVLAASPASAARTLCTSGPVIDLVSQPCVWSSGPPGNDNESAVEAAIFEATGVNVDISLYGKSDDNPALFSFSSGPNGVQATNWSVLDNTLIKYVTVKGANEFKVYELAGLGAVSGLVNTLDLLTPNGRNQPNISHISFWTVGGGAVPEPAAWALMILGFGAVGATLRRRTATLRRFAIS